MTRSRYLAAALVLALAGCTNGGSLTGRDADPEDPADAGASAPDAGPASATDDIAGSWLFETGGPDAPDRVSCDVTIGSGTYDVVCPGSDVPTPAAPDCYQIRDDYHVWGLLNDALGGSVDWIREYDGDGCTAAGFPTGAPVVDVEGALSAERHTPGDDIGFWSVVNGQWSFEYVPALWPDDVTRCEVSLAGGAFEVHCPGDAEEIGPGCLETPGAGITGALNASSLAGELFDEWTRVGEGCLELGLPEYERGEGLPLTGTLLPAPG